MNLNKFYKKIRPIHCILFFAILTLGVFLFKKSSLFEGQKGKKGTGGNTKKKTAPATTQSTPTTPETATEETPAPTPEATTEVTPAPTTEVTTEVTPAPTPEATTEVTPAPTPSTLNGTNVEDTTVTPTTSTVTPTVLNVGDIAGVTFLHDTEETLVKITAVLGNYHYNVIYESDGTIHDNIEIKEYTIKNPQ
jgi:hypothetical protein